MVTTIEIEEFLNLSKSNPVFDVRTPLEFAQGHMPNANNLPIFSNEDRVKIGTAYKQIGREEAILLGFELVGSEWANFIREVKSKTNSKKILIHCWRGGMRSNAMAWAMSFYGFEVFILKGGYKAYRNFVLSSFADSLQLKIIGGLTGSGKTIIIESLKKQGEQTIDLEYLAQHQGSAFGSMGQLVQPTQEQFENNLAFEIKQFDNLKNIWLEDESITIGKRVIPAGLWDQMRIADLKVIEIPKTERLKLLLASYGILPKPFLIESTQKISKRLGPKLTQETIIAIENNEMQTFIENVLYYYDKTYSTGLINKKDRAQILYPFDYFDADKIAQFLIQQMNTNGRN
jgi:tRNA 2-selenouridine synthase